MTLVLVVAAATVSVVQDVEWSVSRTFKESTGVTKGHGTSVHFMVPKPKNVRPYLGLLGKCR